MGEDDFTFINLDGRKYKNLQEYDSVQKNLPKAERDGWFKKIIQKKNLQLKEKYKNDSSIGVRKLGGYFLA